MTYYPMEEAREFSKSLRAKLAEIDASMPTSQPITVKCGCVQRLDNWAPVDVWHVWRECDQCGGTGLTKGWPTHPKVLLNRALLAEAKAAS